MATKKTTEDDRDQDMRIAETCLGWKRGTRWGNGNGEWIFPEGAAYFRSDWDGTPKFAASPQAAMMLVAAWRGDFNLRRQNGQWKASFFRPSHEYEEWGKTLPAAICAAALRAFADIK